MIVNDKPLEDITEVDFHKIDWNKLEPEDFQLLSAKLMERQKLAKIPAKSLGSKNKFIVVTLKGKNYSLPENLVNRIKSCKSDTIKNKIIDEAMITYSPLQSL